MVQLDISALVNQLEKVSGIPDQGMEPTGTDYLLKHIALPLLNGEDILIQDIDFEAFDEDDVRVMRQRCEEMSGDMDISLPIFRTLCSGRPLAEKNVEFV